MYCSVDVLVELLDNGIDIDATVNPEGMTALEYATHLQRIDVLRVLLQRGASADHVGPWGLNAFFYAFYPPENQLQKGSTIDTVRVLNEYIYMDPSATWDHGGNALHAAAMFSTSEDVDALARLGCDITHVDRQGGGALLYAVKYGNSAAFFGLLGNGAKIEANTDDSARNLLMSLIEAKAELHIPSPASFTSDYDTIAKHLLRHHIPAGSPMCGPDDVAWPEGITPQAITWHDFAAAYGPETQAWFEWILFECWYTRVGEDGRIISIDPIVDRDTRRGHVIGEVSQAAQQHEQGQSDDVVWALGYDGGAPDDEEESFYDAAEVL